MDIEKAKKALLREFEHGTLYPFQPHLRINDLDEKARRYLKRHRKEIKYSQGRLDDIPYMYRHEARLCFYHGEFFAVIVFCGTIVEYVLRKELFEKEGINPWRFEKVIDECGEKGILDSGLVEKADRIRNLRNLIAHPFDEKWTELKEKIKEEPDVLRIEKMAIEAIDKMEDILEHFYPIKQITSK